MSDPHPGLENYLKGLPVNIDVDKYANLNALVDEALKKYAAKPAYCNKGKALTYKQLES